jgi:preprotein translocase subunit YajC
MHRLVIVVLAAAALAYAQTPSEETTPAPAGETSLAPAGDAEGATATEGETPVFQESGTGSITGGDAASEPAAQEWTGNTEEAPMGCMGSGGGITGLLPILGMVAIFYFLIIRPQQKQQKRLREMRSNLQRGDRVVTAGGIHGVITNLKNDVVTVKIADNVKIDVDRNSLTVTGQDSSEQESS